MKELLEYFKGDELAANVFKSKYAQEGDITPDDEIWKICEENKHMISNYGRIMNIGTLHKVGSRNRRGTVKPFILKNRLSSNSYYITYNNKFIHRLVAQNFIPNPENKPEVNHIDGNKLNNHVDNLEWCTSSENTQHAYTIRLQTKNPESSSKLTWNDVEDIRNLHQSGLNYIEISKRFNISKSQIGKIIRKEQWK